LSPVLAIVDFVASVYWALGVPEQVRQREDIDDVRVLSVDKESRRVDWRFVDVLNNNE